MTANGVTLGMTDMEQAILRVLVELDLQVKSMPTANPKPNLLPLFSRLDQLAKQLPPDTSPDLVHYLQKKSYGKARLFLEGRDGENVAGNCGHQ
jgi:hypothetical protein